MELALASCPKAGHFRKVSEVTVGEQFPFPVLSDLLMNLGEVNKFFSSLDLLTGYWQLPMAPRVASNYGLQHTEWTF